MTPYRPGPPSYPPEPPPPARPSYIAALILAALIVGPMVDPLTPGVIRLIGISLAAFAMFISVRWISNNGIAVGRERQHREWLKAMGPSPAPEAAPVEQPIAPPPAPAQAATSNQEALVQSIMEMATRLGDTMPYFGQLSPISLRELTRRSALELQGVTSPTRVVNAFEARFEEIHRVAATHLWRAEDGNPFKICSCATCTASKEIKAAQGIGSRVAVVNASARATGQREVGPAEAEKDWAELVQATGRGHGGSGR